MRIVDKSGGFWLDILTKRKTPEIAFKQNYMPDTNAAKLLGEEIISGMRGSKKHKFMVRHLNGRNIISRVPNGTYSTGILKRKSPDGTPYIPLSPATLALRKADGNTRGPAFILRETSKHIFEGLKIKALQLTRNGAKVIIGWFGEDEKRAVEHHTGFSYNVKYENKVGEVRSYQVDTPARPHIGISGEVVNVLTSFWKKLAK